MIAKRLSRSLRWNKTTADYGKKSRAAFRRTVSWSFVSCDLSLKSLQKLCPILSNFLLVSRSKIALGGNQPAPSFVNICSGLLLPPRPNFCQNYFFMLVCLLLFQTVIVKVNIRKSVVNPNEFFLMPGFKYNLHYGLFAKNFLHLLTWSDLILKLTFFTCTFPGEILMNKTF